MEHQSHFPDLSPNDLLLFSKINCGLKGRRFEDTEDTPHQKKYDGTENNSTT
jgi:hypothetical protein